MFMQHHTKPRQITIVLPLPRITNATILISKLLQNWLSIHALMYQM